MRASIASAFVCIISLCLDVTAGAAEGPFPPDASAWTEQIKQQQRDAGVALIRQVDAAVKAGQAATLKIKPGHYRFDAVSNPGAWNAAHLVIQNARDLVIDAQGSTFWFEEQASGLVIMDSQRVTLKNLFIDWDPLPFTQGTIESVNTSDNTIHVRIDPGYERVTEGLAATTAAPGDADRSHFRGALFDPKTRHLKLGQSGFQIAPFWKDKLADGSYRIQVSGFWGLNVEQVGCRPGDLIALWARKGHGVLLAGCGDVRLEDVTLYAAPFICFQDAVGPGGNTYRRCSIVRRPGTSRLMAGNADGFNAGNLERGPIIEGCIIDTIGDDFVNVQGHMARVLAQPDATTVVVSRMNYRDDPGENAPVSFYDRATMEPLGSAKVLASRIISVELTAEKCLADLKVRWHSGDASGLAYGATVRAQQLTLDRPIQLKPDAVVSCEKFSGRDTVVRDCHFSGSLARGMLIQGPDVKLQGNTFENVCGSSIEIGGSPIYWGEGGVVSRAQIIGNTFRSVIPAINILPMGKDGRAQPQSAIRIEGNTFISDWPAIIGDNVTDITIQRNRFQRSPLPQSKNSKTPGSAQPVELKNDKGSQISDNGN